jgi:hypothetical protein
MNRNCVEPLIPDAFRALMEEKNWTTERLGARWLLGVRRVQQIVVDPYRSRYFDDALRGLPVWSASQASLVPMPSDEFMALMKAKGWSNERLGMRWLLGVRRLQQVAADPHRSRYFDDALRGTPYWIVDQ